MNPIKLYFTTYLYSTILNALLLIGICNFLGFDRKSAICVYLYGIGGFVSTGIIFFTPLLLFFKSSWQKSIIIRRLIFILPSILFLIWFLSIIVFKIQSLYPYLSYGYISRLPHFYIQILSSITISILLYKRTIKTFK